MYSVHAAHGEAQYMDTKKANEIQEKHNKIRESSRLCYDSLWSLPRPRQHMYTHIREIRAIRELNFVRFTIHLIRLLFSMI